MRLIKYIFLMSLLCSIGSSTKIISYKGILDRMENDQAIILIESIDKTLIVQKDSLPAHVRANTWLNIDLIGYTYQVVSIDYQLTEKSERKSTYLINKLREKSKPK